MNFGGTNSVRLGKNQKLFHMEMKMSTVPKHKISCFVGHTPECSITLRFRINRSITMTRLICLWSLCDLVFLCACVHVYWEDWDFPSNKTLEDLGHFYLKSNELNELLDCILCMHANFGYWRYLSGDDDINLIVVYVNFTLWRTAILLNVIRIESTGWKQMIDFSRKQIIWNKIK